MAVLYKASGGTQEVVPKNGKKFSLEELQGFVGGYIELVPDLTGKRKGKEIVYCNEEGKLEGLPLNREATLKYAPPGDVLVGDVIVCSRKEVR